MFANQFNAVFHEISSLKICVCTMNFIKPYNYIVLYMVSMLTNHLSQVHLAIYNKYSNVTGLDVNCNP